MGSDFFGMALELGEVVEGVGAIELTGMNEAHIEIADTGTVVGLVEERIFATMETFP
jgi:hypothetical protein